LGTDVKAAVPLLAAAAVCAALVGSYAALGGGSYEPRPVANPCTVRDWRNPHDLPTTLEQVALSALDGAACTLGVSREELVLALRSEKAFHDFASNHGFRSEDAERAVHQGLERALNEAEDAGALSGFVGSLARSAIETLEPWRLIDALQQLRSLLGG
jgi:hypothetical protein